MSRHAPIELPNVPGIMTEETDRGAKGRYKDGDKIRFRQRLAEKLGGWVIHSLGQTIVGINEELSQDVIASSTYAALATTINLATAVTCADGDPVWLFSDSLIGGLGGRTVNDVNALAGVFVFDLSAAITATASEALIIDYPEAFAGGANVTGGGTAGSNSIMISAPLTKYLRAGSKVRVLTNSGEQITELAANHTGGATTLTLLDSLIDDVQAGTPNVFVYAVDSFIQSNTQGIVIRFLAGAVTAATQIIITESLPEDANGLNVDIRTLRVTACNGAQTNTTALLIAPSALFGISSIAIFPDGLVILPADDLEQTSFLGFCRAVIDWTSIDQKSWSAIGTDLKLYLVSSGALYDITPIRENGTLIDPFATSVTGAFDPNLNGDPTYVEVTDVVHGGQVGNFVRFSDAAAVGGITIDGEFQIVSVTDPDTYVIRNDTPATSTASGGGSVQYEYDIDIGASGNITVQGYGTGGYGIGPYGEGDPAGGVIRTLRTWSLDNFGEDLLASPNGGALYHWDRSLGSTSRAALVTNAPASMQRMLISPESRHVIAFGAGTGSAATPGVEDKLLIRWSDQENFNVWIPSSTNLAGDLRLDVGSEIITAVESRGDIIVNTDESLHALQSIGGQFVFGLRHLGQSVTIISANAAVDVNGRVYFMGTDDFLRYDGVLEVMSCDVRNHVFDDINSSQGQKVYAAVNKLFTEIWWFYPSALSETNDRYVKLNYKDMVWDFGTMERTAFHDSSQFLRKPYATFDGLIFQHETGVDDTDENDVLLPMLSFIETWDAEIDESGSRVMHVGAMIPDFENLVGSVDFTLKGRKYPQAATQKTKGPFTILPATERQSVRMRSRQIALRVESNSLGDDWRMGTWRTEARPHGRRGG